MTISEDYFQNKVIIVFGATGGIGLELCKNLAATNSKIVMIYNCNVMGVEFLKNIYKDSRAEAEFYQCDIRSEASVRDVFAMIVKENKKIDVLVNLVGIASDRPVAFMGVDEWKNVLDVNLTGAFICCKVALKYMVKENQGKIVNVGSFLGINGSKGQANYAASKAGMIALTKTIAKEYGRYNIAANVVCPGRIATHLNEECEQDACRNEYNNMIDSSGNLLDAVNIIMLLMSDYIKSISGQVFILGARD